MDRDGAVRLQRGIVWFGAPVLMLLIKLCIDAKAPSIVAQVRSELYTLAVMLSQTVVMSAIPLARTSLQELWNHAIYRICTVVDRTMRTTTAPTNKDRIPTAFLKATAAHINGYCQPIVHERNNGTQSLFDGAAAITLTIKAALVRRLLDSSAGTPSALSNMGAIIAGTPMLLSGQAWDAATQWLTRFQDVVLMKVVNAAVSEAWRRRWEILDLIMLLGLSAVILKALVLLGEGLRKSLILLGAGLRAASQWLQHVGTRVAISAQNAIVLPIWRKRWLIVAILVILGSSVILQRFFNQSWEMGKAALVAKEEQQCDSTYHRLHPGGSLRGSWVERTSHARSVMMDFEPAPK